MWVKLTETFIMKRGLRHPSNLNYNPHGMVFGRKHNMLFEVADDEIRLTCYNGDDQDDMQVLAKPYYVLRST